MVNSQFSEDDTVGSSVYCISPIHFNEVLCYVTMNSILVPYIHHDWGLLVGPVLFEGEK